MTWSSRGLASRIDRFYISKQSAIYISSVNTSPCSISDHDFLYMDLNLPNNSNYGRGYWKFNNSLLLDSTFCTSFITFWTHLIGGKILTLDIWEHFKIEIRNFIQHYSRDKVKRDRKSINSLESQYKHLIQAECSNPGQYTDQIAACKEELAKLHLDSATGSMIRSRTMYLQNQEKPSRYFFRTEVKRGQDKSINKITHSDHTYSKSEDILPLFRTFYSNLFTAEPVDESMFPGFMDSLPVLADDQKASCEGFVSYNECLSALRQMKNNKSPGSDGLTKEFFLHFFPMIGNTYVTIMNHCLNSGTLSTSQRLGLITLICKDRDHSDLMKNWRPISLLNLDYKILTKTLTNRLKLVIEDLVSPYQTCGVPGRSIVDSNHLLRSVVDYVNQKGSYCGILSLDQEKAFDRVDHGFLFACLKQYGFGPTFISWIKLLYTNIYSSVIVNRYISEQFPITRSVRQGCSLSPLLYVLVLEPLLRKLTLEPNISGLQVPGSGFDLKYVAFADDINTIFTSDESVGHTFRLCHMYGRASGSKLNMQKCKGFYFGKWSTRSDHPFGISWADTEIKIYGVTFSKTNYSKTNWDQLHQKLFNVLNTFRSRDISFQGKSTVIHSLACSKLWYIGSIFPLPKLMADRFTRLIFQFFWGSTFEPVRRTVMMNDIYHGGFSLINISIKLKAFMLSHIKKLINEPKNIWSSFAIYWIGMYLRKHNSSFASLQIPHSTYIPPFYTACLSTYREFIALYPDISFHTLSTKEFYTLLMKPIITKPKIERIFPQIQFVETWRDIHSPFFESYLSTLNWKIVHQIIPVNYDWWKRNVSKNKNCNFCKNVETISHLFCECSLIQPLWQLIFAFVSNYYGKDIRFSSEIILFNNLPIAPSPDIRTVCSYLLAIGKSSIWKCRNEVQYHKKIITSDSIIMNFIYKLKFRILVDFQRFSRMKFFQHWCISEIFCSVDINDTLLFNIT